MALYMAWGETTLLIGLIIPFITGSGPALYTPFDIFSNIIPAVEVAESSSYGKKHQKCEGAKKKTNWSAVPFFVKLENHKAAQKQNLEVTGFQLLASISKLEGFLRLTHMSQLTNDWLGKQPGLKMFCVLKTVIFQLVIFVLGPILLSLWKLCMKKAVKFTTFSSTI